MYIHFLERFSLLISHSQANALSRKMKTFVILRSFFDFVIVMEIALMLYCTVHRIINCAMTTLPSSVRAALDYEEKCWSILFTLVYMYCSVEMSGSSQEFQDWCALCSGITGNPYGGFRSWVALQSWNTFLCGVWLSCLYRATQRCLETRFVGCCRCNKSGTSGIKCCWWGSVSRR